MNRDQYLHFDSCHAEHMKNSLKYLKVLAKRFD